MKLTPALRSAVLFILLAAICHGQINTATVSGSVSDVSHATIPGAQLQLQSELTGASLNVTSNSTGQFTVSV